MFVIWGRMVLHGELFLNLGTLKCGGARQRKSAGERFVRPMLCLWLFASVLVQMVDLPPRYLCQSLQWCPVLVRLHQGELQLRAGMLLDLLLLLPGLQRPGGPSC